MRFIDPERALRESAGRCLRDRLSCSPIVVALSGGVDSVVLLHALLATGVAVRAFHVNHALSPHAATWQKFCENLCAELGVEVLVRRLELGTSRTSGLEADARTARYDALRDMARGSSSDIIALAHHADDQAETVLLQLLRGGASRGLAGMPEWRIDGAVALWRPMLGTDRASIVDYARRRALAWIDDESNADLSIKRNFIRARVLPALEQGFPDYRAAFGRTASTAAGNSQLLHELAAIDIEKATTAEGGIATEALRTLGVARATNLLRHHLRACRIALPATDQLCEFIRQAIDSGCQRHPSVATNDGWLLYADRGQISIAALSANFDAVWHCESTLQLPHGRLVFELSMGGGIAASRVPSTGFRVLARSGGERIKLELNRPHRTLTNLMREAGIPSTLRSAWPLLVDGDRVVAIPGIGVSVNWRCPSGGPGWTVKWQPRAPMSAQSILKR